MPSARFASFTKALAVSQLWPTSIPMAMSAAYQRADALAAGMSARAGLMPTMPANGVTAARTPGRKRLTKMPSMPCRA